MWGDFFHLLISLNEEAGLSRQWLSVSGCPRHRCSLTMEWDLLHKHNLQKFMLTPDLRRIVFPWFSTKILAILPFCLLASSLLSYHIEHLNFSLPISSCLQQYLKEQNCPCSNCSQYRPVFQRCRVIYPYWLSVLGKNLWIKTQGLGWESLTDW